MNRFIHPRAGTELDWLALDVNWRVGLFSSWGWGAVPRAVADRLEEVDQAIARLTVLKAVGTCADVADDLTDWIEPCCRGLFVFDWAPVHPPCFTRVAFPSRPIAVEDLGDEQIREIAELVRLGVAFERTKYLEMADFDVEPFRFP